jgi:hypothetical protein
VGRIVCDGANQSEVCFALLILTLFLLLSLIHLLSHITCVIHRWLYHFYQAIYSNTKYIKRQKVTLVPFDIAYPIKYSRCLQCSWPMSIIGRMQERYLEPNGSSISESYGGSRIVYEHTVVPPLLQFITEAPLIGLLALLIERNNIVGVARSKVDDKYFVLENFTWHNKHRVTSAWLYCRQALY